MERKRELFAWLAKDPHGEEGIIMVPTLSGGMPLVSIDSSVAMKARDLAQRAATARDHTVRLVRFVEVSVIAEVDP